jgi:hypothetical protein
MDFSVGHVGWDGEYVASEFGVALAVGAMSIAFVFGVARAFYGF